MRAATYTTGTLISISLYLIVAATLALTPALIAVGSVAIALVAAIAFVASEGSQTAS
jgi:hypothetical protein